MSDHLKNLSQVYLEQISESAVPGKPAEKLKTDRAGYSIPKADQMSAAERIKKKTAEKRAALEKKHGKKMDDHPEYPKKKYVDEADMSGAPSIKDAKPAKKTNVKYDPHMKVMAPSVKEALDPVGKEDGDVDNDGKKTTSDKYIMKRRAAIRKAIAKKKVSEGLSTDVENPSKDIKKLASKAVKRIDTDVDGDVENNDKSKGKFGEFVPSADGKKRVYTKIKEELVIEVSGEEKQEKIKEKKVNNKITINPELKESISEIGGEVLFISEVEEIDSIAESVHIELIEDGYPEEQVIEALQYAIDEVTNPAKVSSFKMKKEKYTPKSETKKEPKKSLKDRIKSVARKALDAAGGAVGKVMKKKAQIQAAPAKAKKKLGSYVDRAKAVAKAGYDRERGPVEKKPTTYRGSGVGRKEKIGEGVASDPKMQQLQKKQIMLDRQKLSARVQAMQKKKPAPEQAQEEMSIADQMRISREAAAKRKPYQPGDREKQRAAQMRSAAKKAKKDTRTDAERMADATGPRPGSRYRGD